MPKDHQRNTSAMLEAQKKKSEEKLQTLKSVLTDMVANKEPIEYWEHTMQFWFILTLRMAKKNSAMMRLNSSKIIS